RAVPGRAVQVQWMRDDEFAWEPYGSAMVVKTRAALDAAGNVVDWQLDVWSYPHSTRPEGKDGVNLIAAWHLAEPHPAGTPANPPLPPGGSHRNAIPLYDFPNQRVSNHLILQSPLRASALRALGGHANVFAIESFMDELALAAGADAIEFRLRHLKDARACGDRDGRAKIRLEQERARRGPWPRYRIRALQEPGLLRCSGRGSRYR